MKGKEKNVSRRLFYTSWFSPLLGQAAIFFSFPGTEELGGPQSMGLHKVEHNWWDLAAAAAAIKLHNYNHKKIRRPSNKNNLVSTAVVMKEKCTSVLASGHTWAFYVSRSSLIVFYGGKRECQLIELVSGFSAGLLRNVILFQCQRAVGNVDETSL